MVGAPRSSDGFCRELTPTWLATACLLNGQLPPDLSRPFRYAYLGCGRGVTSAVVAAVHPDCEVWAWDWRPECVEATRRLRDSAGLKNLVVHERPGLPQDLGGGPLDFVIVDKVMVAASDSLRSAIFEAIATNLRPGGLACVTYQTTVGWIEIAPVVRLMRYVAQRYTGSPDGLVDHILELLASLRAGGAAHFVQRPSVAAWLDELAVTDDETIVATYLTDPFRPMSHAEVADALGSAASCFVGGARLIDELDDDVPPDLLEMLHTAPSAALREAYRDIAVRCSNRLDVFRHGAATMPADEHAARIAELELTGTPGSDDQGSLDLDPIRWKQLRSETVRASQLGFDDSTRLLRTLRHVFHAGQAHPVAQHDTRRGSAPEAAAVTVAIGPADADGSQLVVAPVIGSAVVATRADREILARLGAC